MAFKHFWVQYKIGGRTEQTYIKSQTFTVGRAMECDLSIKSEAMSRRHFQVSIEDKKIFIKDLGSTNGTFLSGEKLVAKVPYAYKEGEKLYIDASKEVVFKISPIFDRAQAVSQTDDDLGMGVGVQEDHSSDPGNFELEQQDVQMQRLEMDRYHKEIEKFRKKNVVHRDEGLLAQAGESVENVVDDFVYVLKNARFNREKKIREAEKQSQILFEKAKKEIEEYRQLLEEEIVEFQKRVESQAVENLRKSEEQAKQIIEKAQIDATAIQVDIEKRQKNHEIECERQLAENLLKAQQKYQELIAEAKAENDRLTKDSQKQETLKKELEQTQVSIKNDIERLKNEKENFQKVRDESKKTCDQALLQMEQVQQELDNLLLQNKIAKDELNIEIPKLEKRVLGLEKKIEKKQDQLNEKHAEIALIEKNILARQDDIEKWQEQSIKAEKRLDGLTEKLNVAEKNLIELSELKKERSEELEREVAERKLKIKILEDEAAQAMEKKWSKLEEKIAKREKETQDERDLILGAAEEKAQTLRLEAENYSQSLKEKAEEYAEGVSEEADTYAKTAQEEADSYAKTITQEADQYAKEVRETADKELADLKQKQEDGIKEAYQETIESANREAETILQETKNRADSEAARLVSETQADLARQRENAEKEIDKLKKKAESQYEKNEALIKRQKTKADDEISKLKSEAQREVEELRKQVVRNLEAKKKEFETEVKERDRLRSLRLQKELKEVLRARLSPYIKDEVGLEKMDQLVTNSVNAIVLDEVEEDAFLAEKISDVDPALYQQKVKKFYIYAGSGLAGLLILIFLLPTFNKVAKDSGRQLAQIDQEQTKKHIEKVKKDNDLSAQFNPKQSDKYEDSYTRRVLYTKNYVKTELDKDFREDWILALQDYFVHELRLDENNLVPFIAQEANLIRELQEARSKINGNFVDQGVARMQEIEQAFVDKLKRHIKKESNYKKIMKFKKNFYLKNRKK